MIKNNKILLKAGGFILFSTILFSSVIASAKIKERVDNAISDYLHHHFINATFVVANENSVITSGAKGFYEMGGKHLKAKQQMPIASCSKMFTAAAILRLQERNMLDVNDVISKYLDKKSYIWQGVRIPTWVDEVTIHQLLTHTSGIVDYMPNFKADPTTTHADIIKGIVKFASAQDLAFSAGTKYQYSNSNYTLLGLIIEQLSGKNLASYFQDEFFTVLGMKSSHLATLDEAIKFLSNDETSPYPIRYYLTPNGTSKPNMTLIKDSPIIAPFADGGIISTASDLMIWNKALHQGRVLSPKSYELMIKKYIQAPDKMNRKIFVGYGVYIVELGDGKDDIYQRGSAIGIRSEIGYVKDKKLYYSILSNVMTDMSKVRENNIDLQQPLNQVDIIYFKEAILKSLQ